MKPTTYTFIKTFILLYGAALLATWGISEYNQEAFALKDTRVFLIIALVLAWSKSKRLKK
jgi:hypothetical protein